MTGLREGSLFTGTNALGMAAGVVLRTEPAWFADIDPGASTLLAHHYPDVPNLGDITAIDWGLVAKLSPIDILTAGWPCQPWSLAGKQQGADDERALWPEVDRAIRILRPRIVLLENVPAVVAAGELHRVATTLAAYGYRFAWCVLGAADVGACHRRNRVFLVATPDTDDLGHERSWSAWDWRNGSAHGGLAATDPAGNGRHEGRPEPARLVGGPDAAERSASPTHASGDPLGEQPVAEPGGGGASVTGLDRTTAPADADSAGPQGPESAPGHDMPAWGGYEPAIRRWEAILGRPAPAPTVVGTRGGRVLNPALPQWMMGLPEGWITSVPGLTRNQQLKLAGNGVVPQQAVAAFRHLLPLLGLSVPWAA